jgi:adenylate kinase
MKQRIVLLGPPASGKGTQSDRIAARFGIPHVSTGALLRLECTRGTQLGREADSWTRHGLLVPDELAIRIIQNWMSEHGPRFIFDGFPRSVAQAEHLDQALAHLHAPIDLLVVLELSDGQIRNRTTTRISCLNCGATFSALLDGVKIGSKCPRCGEALVRRTDDEPEAVEKRLEVYRKLTFPVIGYYERMAPHLLYRVDAGEGSDAVFAVISALVDCH